MKVIRFSLSIPLTLLAGVAGVAGLISLFLACAVYGIAKRIYGGSLSHNLTSWVLSSGDKRTETDACVAPQP
jgi:hypothetical protein